MELSNLQRQVIHGMDWLGQSKVRSAANRLQVLNPNCRVEVHEQMLDRENALELIAAYDLVCDGSDNFPTRYLVNDACVLQEKPLIYGSVQRFDGQASVFNRTPNSPNYRDLVPEPPPVDQVPSCAEAGVMGVLPGLIGLIQATEAIKLITGIGRSLDGRLLVVDALTMRFCELALQRDPDRPAIDRLVDYKQFCRPTASAMNSISVIELKLLLDGSPDDMVLLDVRKPAEAELAVIPGAVLIPLATIQSGEAIERIRGMVDTGRLYVHCKLGGRSAQAVELLAQQGIPAINVDGGIDAWSVQVDQDVPRY